MPLSEEQIDEAVIAIFSNNKNEALDREQLLDQVSLFLGEKCTPEEIRLSTIRCVDEDWIQPALYGEVLVYCSVDCKIEHLHYKEFFVLKSKQYECGCGCHHE